MDSADNEPGAWYDVVESIKDRAVARRVADAVMHALRSRVAVAQISAHTDYSGRVTPDAEAAEERLKKLIKSRGLRGIDIDLDLAKPEEAELLYAYLPWSINAELFDHADQLIAAFHDCTYVVSMRVTSDRAAELAATLQGLVTIAPSAPFKIWPALL